MKYLIHVIRVLVGALFIFSGAVKAIDPLGTSFKMHEYFAAFGSVGMKGFWESMNAVSTPFAVTMIVVEIGAGIALLAGWKPRFTVWVLFAMTMLFTLLTGFTYLSGYCPNTFFAVYSVAMILLLILAAAKFNKQGGRKMFYLSMGILAVYLVLIAQGSAFFGCPFTETKMKVTDCGCFGDFLKLKPWETFWKDIILDVLIFMLLIGVLHIRPVMRSRYNHALVTLGTAGSLLFCLSNYMWGLPVVDFRPYKEGNNIRELRNPVRPETREFVFVYQHTGTGDEREFKMDELDQVDDNWEFVDRIDKLIDPGIPAKINNLFISDEGGNDVTEELLSTEGYSLVVVIYNMKKSRKRPLVTKLNPLAAACEKAGIPFFGICGGDLPVDPFRHEYQTPFQFTTADDIALKTMIRSNPGLMLLKDGVVVKKWHHMYFPKFRKLNKKYFKKDG